MVKDLDAARALQRIGMSGPEKGDTIASGHCRDLESVSLARVCNSGTYFSQTSVVCFRRGFSCCPLYRSVRYSEVSARGELTVFIDWLEKTCY